VTQSTTLVRNFFILLNIYVLDFSSKSFSNACLKCWSSLKLSKLSITSWFCNSLKCSKLMILIFCWFKASRSQVNSSVVCDFFWQFDRYLCIILGVISVIAMITLLSVSHPIFVRLPTLNLTYMSLFTFCSSCLYAAVTLWSIPTAFSSSRITELTHSLPWSEIMLFGVTNWLIYNQSWEAHSVADLVMI